MIEDSFRMSIPVRLPARLDAGQVAKVLGFQEHDIPVLVACGMLTPLGNPVQNSIKYFARHDIEGIADDVKWLHRATKAVAGHWAKQNARRKSAHVESDNERIAA
jgi:hypothetical protein